MLATSGLFQTLDNLSVVNSRPALNGMDEMRSNFDSAPTKRSKSAANSPKLEKGHVYFCVRMKSNILGQVVSNPLIQHHVMAEKHKDPKPGTRFTFIESRIFFSFLLFFNFIWGVCLTGRIWIF